MSDNSESSAVLHGTRSTAHKNFSQVTHSVSSDMAGMVHATHELVQESDHLPFHICTPKQARNHGTPLPTEPLLPHGCTSSNLSCTQNADSVMTIPIHWHEYLEFLYLLNGHMSAVINATTYELDPGELLIINSEDLHMTRMYFDKNMDKTECPYLLIQFSAARLREIFPDLDLLHFQTCIRQEELHQIAGMTELLKKMQTLFEEHPDGYQLLLTSYFYEFLYILYQNFSVWNVERSRPASSRDLERITEIVSWTREHFKNPLTLNDAASHLALSREYFCRIFKKYTGQTYLEYLSSVRTMNFYNQLLTSDLSIPVLMEQNGITNYRTFLRTFRALYGTTPQKLRAGLSGTAS